jgi:hypothetical protein
MKLIVAAMLLLSSPSFRNAHEPTWEEFRSDEGGFSVLMPGTPTPNTVTVALPSGLRQSHTFSATDDEMNTYLVAYSDSPRTKSKDVATGALFDKIREGLLIAQEGRLLGEASVSLDGNPGRALTIERRDDVIVTWRLFVVGERFYQLSAEVRTKETDPHAVSRFLNSFTLLPIKQP